MSEAQSNPSRIEEHRVGTETDTGKNRRARLGKKPRKGSAGQGTVQMVPAASQGIDWNGLHLNSFVSQQSIGMAEKEFMAVCKTEVIPNLAAGARARAIVVAMLMRLWLLFKRSGKSADFSGEYVARLLLETGVIVKRKDGDAAAAYKQLANPYRQAAKMCDDELMGRSLRSVTLNGQTYKTPVEALEKSGASWSQVTQAFSAAYKDGSGPALPRATTAADVPTILASEAYRKVAKAKITIKRPGANGKQETWDYNVWGDRETAIPTITRLLREWTGKLTQAEYDQIMEAMGKPVIEAKAEKAEK